MVEGGSRKTREEPASTVLARVNAVLPRALELRVGESESRHFKGGANRI